MLEGFTKLKDLKYLSLDLSKNILSNSNIS